MFVLGTTQGRGFFVAAGGGSWHQAISHIRTVIRDKKFDVEVSNITSAMSLISVQGPKR
jgi:glycine cleavage system aminomethyltransferase T